jgi:4-amino-4-deoxy-L-arabinose transferase-like glycosyltransferase
VTRTARGLIRGVHPVWWLTAAACTLRLLLFLGRGDYVAFDEGWYLLLGVNVMTGRGFTLSGLQHIALSPLFPLMAGAVNWVIDNPIWSGRIVAALTAGLLVLPCWSIAYRLAGRRTAVIMCVLIAVMPTLSAFVAAYWIGWDLWVGAEPVLHLLLFTGLALALRAWDSERVRDWLLAGIAFALAYLARPEAIIAFGVVGLITGARALLTRWPPRIAQVAALALAFALTAAPYWLYLHGAMGRWAITGRGIDVSATMRRAPATSSSVPRPPHASNTIEQMLWGSDHAPYVQHIYSLDPSGTRLSSLYWGIPLPDTVSVSRPKKSAAPDTTRATTPQPAPRPVEKTRSRLALYARALAQVIPFYLWPFMLLGVVATTRRWRTELIFVLPLVGTSVAIARVVAIDPRTQLLIVPLAAFYAARGIRRAGTYLERNVGRTRVRRGMMSAALATAVARYGSALALLQPQARIAAPPGRHRESARCRGASEGGSAGCTDHELSPRACPLRKTRLAGAAASRVQGCIALRQCHRSRIRRAFAVLSGTAPRCKQPARVHLDARSARICGCRALAAARCRRCASVSFAHDGSGGGTLNAAR